MSERTKDQYVPRKAGNSGWWDSPLAAKLLAILTTLLISYTGYDEYKDRTSKGANSVTVNVASVPDEMTEKHAHGKVYSQFEIEALINKALQSQHDKNIKIFKLKGFWA